MGVKACDLTPVNLIEKLRITPYMFQLASESVDKNGDTDKLKENGKDDVEILIPCNNPECLNSKVTQFATLALCANTLDPVGNGKYFFKFKFVST